MNLYCNSCDHKCIVNFNNLDDKILTSPIPCLLSNRVPFEGLVPNWQEESAKDDWLFKQPHFGVNTYDKDGDVMDEGIILYFNDISIRVSNTFKGFGYFIDYLRKLQIEIAANYNDLI